MNLTQAFDQAVARENANPQGLPADMMDALNTPKVRQAFNAAATLKGLPLPFPMEDIVCASCGQAIADYDEARETTEGWACGESCGIALTGQDSA